MVLGDDMLSAYSQHFKIVSAVVFILSVYVGGWVHGVREEVRGQLAVASLHPCKSQESTFSVLAAGSCTWRALMFLFLNKSSF